MFIERNRTRFFKAFINEASAVSMIQSLIFLHFFISEPKGGKSIIGI